MSGSLRKRLKKAERKWADVAKREEIAYCICRTSMFPSEPDEFELEMNRPCPSHGFRRLGTVFHLCTDSAKTERMDELIAEYKRRLAEHEQSGDGGRNGS